MKISVITAVWNREKTIAHAIESVLKQNYSPIEYVIQDGGSTDRTLDIIHKVAPEAKIVSAKDHGIYDAINRGISRCTGDVIGLMHSDDYFAHDNVLANVARTIEESGADGVYSDLDYVSFGDTNRIVRRWAAGRYSKKKIARGWMPPHPTVYIKREVFYKLGLYDTNFHIAADYDAMLRFLSNGVSLAYLPEVTVKMRTGGESNASIKTIFRKSQEDYSALRKNRVGGLGALLFKNLSKAGQFIH